MAVVVVLFHAGNDWLWDITVTGMAFFFLSSTFLMAMRHPFDRLTARDYGKFVARIVSRLYPLHWLGLAILVAIALCNASISIDWKATVLNALLVHAWSPVHDIHYGISPVTWYMGALLFCYIVYPPLYRLIGQWRLRYKLLLAACLAAVLAVILYPLDIPGREAVYVNPLSRVLDVTVGIALVHIWRILKSRYPRVSYRTATVIELSVFLLHAAVITLHLTTTFLEPWEDVLIWLIPQGAIMLAFVFLHGQEGAIGRLLSWQPLQWLGGISFELYVLHFPAFHIYSYVVSPVAAHYGFQIYELMPWLVWLLLFPMAWAVNRWFTRPVGKVLQQEINRLFP